MSDFVWPYDDKEPIENEIKAHAWAEDDTLTIGRNLTEWITTDRPMEIQDR